MPVFCIFMACLHPILCVTYLWIGGIYISVSMRVMDSNFTHRNVVCTSPCVVAIALIAQKVTRNK